MASSTSSAKATPTSSTPTMAILRMERGSKVGTTHIIEKEETIGRDASQARIIIDDTKASRIHARIFQDNNQYYIEDLKSRNGTLLNGIPILERRLLEPGDYIQIGFTCFSFARELELEKIRKELTGYDNIQEIKKPGMAGVVLKVNQVGLDRSVTLHLLPPNIIRVNPQLKNSFRQHARALSKLNHENIPIILDFEAKESYLYFTTEYLDGVTLAEELAKQNKLSLERSLEIIIAITHALQHAHSQEVLHLDVTPANIMLYSRRVILGGFGIASILGESPEQLSGLVGKIEYLAPEQLKKQKPTIATDIYSLGVVFYELLAGKPPFTGQNHEELAEIIINDPPKAVTNFTPDIPAEIEDFIYRCLEKEPRDRPSNCEEISIKLEDILARRKISQLYNTPHIYTSAICFWFVEILSNPWFSWVFFIILSTALIFILKLARG